MQKRLKVVNTIVFLLLFAVACSNSPSTDEQTSNKKETQKATQSKDNVKLTISAAASLKDAMDVIQNTYQADHPEIVLKFNFGGSGSLQQQISQGAPADLFFSAAEDKFNKLVKEGIIAKEDGMDLLGNELVLVVPKEEESTIAGFQDLEKKDVAKISLGTAEPVPAGKYAKEALENMDVWKNVESKVVYAKDVRQVLSYVETGNVSAGIIYKTDALVSNKVNIAATADSDTHTPIVYPVGIIKNSKHYEAAKDFYNYLQSDDALGVFEEYGFTTK